MYIPNSLSSMDDRSYLITIYYIQYIIIKVGIFLCYSYIVINEKTAMK